MNKKNCVGILVCVIFSVICTLVIYFLFSTFIQPSTDFEKVVSEQKINISGNIIDNNYNNHMFDSRLTRIDDKLYFNHYESDFEYGLYEISLSGVKRVYWKGPRIFGAQYYFYPLRTYKSTLMMFDLEQKIMYSYNKNGMNKDLGLFYNEELGEYVNDSFQETQYGIIYEKRDSVSSCFALALKNENGEKIIIEPKDGSDIHSFYYSDDKLYYELWYQNKDPQLCKNHIRMYNFKDKTDTMIYDFGSEICDRFAIESNYLIFNTKNPNILYVIDLCEPVKKAEEIRELSVSGTFNVYEGKVYICSSTGVYSYDLLSKELSILCDQESKWCYIVDDYWVYFVSEQGALWRVPQVGGETEKVFGY